jgi:hypothetical protein
MFRYRRIMLIPARPLRRRMMALQPKWKTIAGDDAYRGRIDQRSPRSTWPMSGIGPEPAAAAHALWVLARIGSVPVSRVDENRRVIANEFDRMIVGVGASRLACPPQRYTKQRRLRLDPGCPTISETAREPGTRPLARDAAFLPVT